MLGARDNSWEHAGSYDLVALEKLLLSYGTLKHNDICFLRMRTIYVCRNLVLLVF